MYMGRGGSLYSSFECQNVFHHAFSVQGHIQLTSTFILVSPKG